MCRNNNGHIISKKEEVLVRCEHFRELLCSDKDNQNMTSRIPSNTTQKRIVKVWNEEQMSDELSNQLESKNYRGITLFNTIFKIFFNVLFSRLSAHSKTVLA